MGIKKKGGRRALRSNAKPYNNKKGGWVGKNVPMKTVLDPNHLLEITIAKWNDVHEKGSHSVLSLIE